MAPHDDDIVNSWIKNSSSWNQLIESEGIPSRTAVTNAAILSAIESIDSTSLLDIGCGEGWLQRALSSSKIDYMGIDAVAELITIAEEKASGAGRYMQLPLEDISWSNLQTRFDAIVCNFSLLGKESVESFVTRVPELLNSQGHLLIQTIHPAFFRSELPYRDGWLQEDWSAFDVSFPAVAPWYFRRITSWIDLLLRNSFKIISVKEPQHPDSDSPTSLLIIAARD